MKAAGETVRARGAGCGSFIVDGRGTVVGFDGGMEELTGWSASEVVGRDRDLRACLGGGDGSARLDDVRRSGRARSLELRLTCRDGRALDVEAMAVPNGGPSGRVAVGVLRVLARGAAAASVGEAEGIDAQTGLASRATFEARLDDALASSRKTGRSLAVVLCDVDHLRRIGDRLGRDAEDAVIRKLAGILRATVGPRDLAARLRDDDFALVLPDMGRGSARQVAARLRSTVERFRFFSVAAPESSAPRVTLSLGAASFPADADNAADLVERAAEALEEARALGRNRVWCYTRRPRVPLTTPVFLDGAEPSLVGYATDLSPSGLFVRTAAPIGIGMRCALSFPLPTAVGHVHVIGRIVRTVPAEDLARDAGARDPGMGIEFERFGPEDRRAIEAYLFANESSTLRPEGGRFSTP